MTTLLSVKQVAFILKVHPLTIRRYIKEKKLKAIKVGGNIRIEENDLQYLHKDIEPASPQSKMLRTLKKMRPKEFTEDDAFLRMKGRGASISEYEK